MKLLVDTKSKRVLFAEASKEVVDFLFSLLALPVATAVALVEPGPIAHHTGGSVGNLYVSAEKLGVKHGGAVKDEVPRPAAPSSLLLMPASSFEPSRIFFRCQHNYSNMGKRGVKITCGFYMTDTKGTRCPNCSSEMKETLHYVSPAWSSLRNPIQVSSAQSPLASGGSSTAETYTVLDDLTVTPHAPMSAISTITLLGNYGVTELAAVEERTVHLRFREGLGILKASLYSKTVLTDVFLY